MQRLKRIILSMVLCGVLAGTTGAATFTLTSGEVLVGEPVSFDENGMVVRLENGEYAPRTPWGKFSQETLKALLENPKAADFVDPFIELTEEEKQRKSGIVIKDVTRIERPAEHSLLGSFFGSGLGVFIVLVLGGANIYAGYEISIFRAQSPGLVCGLAAIPGLGLISNIVFLSMPTRPTKRRFEEEEEPEPAEMYEPPTLPGVVAARETAEAAAVQAHKEAVGHAKPKLPPTQTFARGQFTFNRRFFETRFASFFGVARTETDKNMLLIIKSARGEHTANRITRVAANEAYFQVEKGGASMEVNIPFVEIKEITLKHRDA